jgi:hypothetical protein
MKTHVLLIFALSLIATAPAPATAVTLESNGWTIRADRDAGAILIAHEKLGVLLRGVRLSLETGRGLQALRGWTAAVEGPNQLAVHVPKPPVAWRFECRPGVLIISSTSSHGVLTALAPAPPGRMPVRLIDPEGTPVDWVGTEEVRESYGGTDTRHPSFLPRQNPEVITFALGQAASENLHSLFDRNTDTAVRFPESARLRRNAEDANLLDLTLSVPGSTVVRVEADYFTKTLGVPYYVPFDDSAFPAPPAVWSSWTSYYSEVREDDMVRNTDWIAAHLAPYGFGYVELDDGYDRDPKGQHDWIENWDRAKFPHGPKWLTDYIKSKGLRAGVWIVPNAYAGATGDHPDWYLRDRQGQFILDYQTPAMDSTNPGVKDFLRKLFTTLDDWGFDYYKFDGEHALPQYAPPVDHNRLYDQTVDPLVAYRERLKLIRETLGPGRFIEGCPAGTPLNGIGFFNSYFNGDDVYNSWQGMYALFSSINANAFLNHLLVYVMPGEGMEVGPPMTVEEARRKWPASVVEVAASREDPLRGFGTTTAEARTLVSWVALTGVAYPLASVLPELPEERTRLLQQTLPTEPILPLDLFSRGTDMRWNIFKSVTPDTYIHNYADTLDLKVNAPAGVFDVVGLTNWRSETETRELTFTEKLGLAPGARYVVFDFWGQKVLGAFSNRMKAEVGPHDTKVLAVHPRFDHPQLVGTSRHITGAYSIAAVRWDPAKRLLHGSSQTVAGDDYSLFFYVPEGFEVSSVRTAANGNRELVVRKSPEGRSLQVTFPGQSQVVDWSIAFAAKGESSQ